MKKICSFCLCLILLLSMTGCGAKFEPTESAIYITPKGEVDSATIEDFSESYYDFDELKSDITEEVADYCDEKGTDSVQVESLTLTEDTVDLRMKYSSVKDYAEFNEVVLFSGTVSEAVIAGYHPGVNLLDEDGSAVNEFDTEANGDLKVVITEESVEIQTTGKILYVSDSVSIVDRKQAKVMEAGPQALAYVLYK